MSFDVMRVRLHLRGVRVTGVVVDTPAELVVGVVSVRKLSSCPFCGRSCRRVHDRRRREIRDLKHGGRPTVLLWTQRRFVCNHCGKRHMETHPQFLGGLTRRLARRLVQDAQVMPIAAVSRRHRVGWHLVMGLVSDWSGLIQDHRRKQSCRVLLIDETSIRKRHRYVTVILNGDNGQVLSMFPGRSKAALSRFFIEQGPRWCLEREDCGHRRFPLLPGSYSSLSSRSSSCPGPLPRRSMVRPRAHSGTQRTATPPTARCETRLPSGPAFAPGSLFSKDMTTSLEPNRDASTGYSPLIRVFGWLGTLYKSSTASIRPTISKAPSTLSNASPTSTKPARFPSTTTPWTPSSTGQTKS